MLKNSSNLEHVKKHFDAGEEVIAWIQGTYETKNLGQDWIRKGTLFATNKRVVFYAKKLFGYDMEVFPYAKISSIESGKGLMGHTISLFASGNKIKMKWINTGDVKAFIEHLQLMAGKKEVPLNCNPSHTVENDVMDQIAKLHTLFKNGALTEEEFNQHKTKLLNNTPIK